MRSAVGRPSQPYDTEVPVYLPGGRIKQLRHCRGPTIEDCVTDSHREYGGPLVTDGLHALERIG